MRILIILTLLSFFCLSCMNPFVYAGITENFPKPQGYITDQAGLLKPQTARHLEELISYVHQKTTAEIAVVTLKSIEPYPIEDYAVRLFETWGIGQKGKDNGVLLLVALQERRIRIEVGYGLEGAITDGTAGEIIRRIITPAFKKGQFDQGLLAGTEAILQLVGKEYHVELPEGLGFKTQFNINQHRPKPGGSSGIGGLLLFLIFFFILYILFKTGLWPLLFLGFPFGGGGWSRGGGGFGGGFGGFGGGMSGGGGASGSW